MSRSTTSLSKALTFAYANASRFMRPSDAKEDVHVYVEDEGDIMFWRQFFSPFNDTFTFKVSIYHCNDKERAGKDYIMKAIENGDLPLHSRALTCLDADYDLIIDNYHPYTSTLRKNPYVITTYWYSIENLKADPLHLSLFYNYCTLTKNCSTDFIAIVKEISKTYYDLLLRLILCQSHDSLKQEYTIAAFGEDLKKCTCDKKNHVSTDTKNYVAARIKTINQKIVKYSAELTDVGNLLKDMCVEPENCYRLMKGHHWVNRVIVPLLLPLVKSGYQMMVQKKKQCFENIEKQNKIIEHYSNNVGISNDSDECIKNRIERLIDDHIHNEDLDIANVIFDDIKTAIIND